MAAVAAADANVAHALRGGWSRPSKRRPWVPRSGCGRPPSRVPVWPAHRPPPARRRRSERPSRPVGGAAELSPAWVAAEAEARSRLPRLRYRPSRRRATAQRPQDALHLVLRAHVHRGGGAACGRPGWCRRRPREQSPPHHPARRFGFLPPRLSGRRRPSLLPSSPEPACRPRLLRRPQLASPVVSRAAGLPELSHAVARAGFAAGEAATWSRRASPRASFRCPRLLPLRRRLPWTHRLPSPAASCAAFRRGGRAAASGAVARLRESPWRLPGSRRRSCLRPDCRPAPDPRVRPNRRTPLQRSLPPRPRRSVSEGSRRRPGLRRRSSRSLRSL